MKMRKKFGSGLVIGKFYPPHLGHYYLIDTALSKVKDLTVIVCYKRGQSISGKLRAKWIKESYPNINIKVINDIYPEDDSEIWAKKTLSWLGFIPEFVFTSEDYGDKYAVFLKNKHILVDRDRKKVQISASKIRENPLKYLNYLPQNVRMYYEKNLCSRG